jgi:hypothetical protein
VKMINPGPTRLTIRRVRRNPVWERLCQWLWSPAEHGTDGLADQIGSERSDPIMREDKKDGHPKRV